MQHDWFMYHLRSTYKNRLDFPFKKMEAIVKRASKIIGEGRHLEQACKDKIFQKTK